MKLENCYLSDYLVGFISSVTTVVKLSCSDEEAFVTMYRHDCYLHQGRNTKIRCGLAQIQEQEVKSGSKWEAKVAAYIVELKNVRSCVWWVMHGNGRGALHSWVGIMNCIPLALSHRL